LTRWDDWVPQDRLSKFTEDNRELAVTLRREAEAALRQRSGQKSSAKKRGGSDKSSARGSEERQSSVPPRGTKRGRDNEIEKVRVIVSSTFIGLTRLHFEPARRRIHVCYSTDAMLSVGT
jgi:hypothetical protein